MENAMENAGMLLVQVERLLRTVSDTNGQVCDIPIRHWINYAMHSVFLCMVSSVLKMQGLSNYSWSITLQLCCAFCQSRLFFVWLTKSLRQLNGDAGPQANQLPAIDRLVHYPFNIYNYRGSWYFWINEIVLRAKEVNYNLSRRILCIWQCRGGRLFTYSLWERPSRATSCTRRRWPSYGCQTVSYLFLGKPINSLERYGVFCSLTFPNYFCWVI